MCSDASIIYCYHFVFFQKNSVQVFFRPVFVVCVCFICLSDHRVFMRCHIFSPPLERKTDLQCSAFFSVGQISGKENFRFLSLSLSRLVSLSLDIIISIYCLLLDRSELYGVVSEAVVSRPFGHIFKNYDSVAAAVNEK